MNDETTISTEEITATIVDTLRPRTETQQAENDYQQGFTPALVDYDRERCVYQEIEERARVSPRKAAIAYRGRELSYGELNAQANRMARYLVRMGVGKGDLVGIFMRRTPQMIVAMLGVWKAGAGYVPLDPQYPPERLRFMLQDAPSKLVITTNSVRDRVGEIPSKILYVDEEREQIEKESSENLDEVLSSGQVAYVIYTAGSTGAPRGVMLAHQSAMSFVTWAKSAFQQEELEGVLAAASIGSDLSIFELWATLSCGGTVVLANDLMDWWEHIDDEDPHPVRLINTLPSAMTKLIQQGSLPKSVRTVNLTGEALNKTLVSQLSKAGALKQVNNLYGQSETTTYSTWTTVGAGDKVMVGRAVANTQLYVLDEEMQLVPGGVAGELYVGGDGLALGYLKNFRLTAERFLPNPFSKGNGSRMYRTGDVVRWQEDGQMEYLSRADQQVRLGGYRIKLEEIEAAVLDHTGVSQAVVVVRVDHTGVKRLMGYVVGRGKKIDPGQLRGYLQQRLPEYMVPSAFQQLDSLPLTPNGKIDRQALAELESRETIEETGTPALTPAEELITGVWSSLLGKSNIGRDDNFFGLGGHSLLVTQVISRIREVFQVELPMQVMFETPTVAGLARSIESSTRIEAPPLRRRSRQERIRLSFGQERLWFLSRYEAEASLYNVPIAVRLRGALNIEAAQASLQEMVNRHEVLRTSFPEVGDSTIQDIAAEMEMPFAVAEIREDELDQVLREQARRSFDLSHGPLIRASLFHISSQDHVLLVVMHHIVSDGWSLGVMLREFNVLYDSFSRGAASPLPPLPIQYADYSEWQREWLQGEVLERQLDYWRKQLAGHETLNLPTDRPHSAKPTLAGAMETSRLPEPLVSKLKLLSDQQGVTLFMTLLAGFEILLYRYTGQTDISVGSGIANRNRQELEPLIGFFVNTLVLRTQFTEDSSVAELLQRVRDVSLQAYAHQDIPFERLVEALDPVRELSRTPFFQALFVLQNAPLPTVSWDGLEAAASILETGTAKFDLTLSAREEDGELELSLEYRTELFNAERMKRLLQHYRTLLEGIVVSVDARISELEILSEPERQQLLVEWNRTEAPYSTNKCVHELFEEQAAQAPAALAVVCGARQLTYQELNQEANQLANYLRKRAVGPDVLVGICMHRSLEMIIGILGTLKAGAAYVPLDPAYPAKRLAAMVEEVDLRVVLTTQELRAVLPEHPENKVRQVCLDSDWSQIAGESGDNLQATVSVGSLCYVIFTSGSTGKAKAAAVSHGGWTNLMRWFVTEFNVTSRDKVLVISSFSFDITQRSIVMPLISGAQLHLLASSYYDPALIVQTIAEQGITRMNCAPSTFYPLVENTKAEFAKLRSLHTLFLGGEAISASRIREWAESRECGAEIANVYGAAECSDVSTFHVLKNYERYVESSVPIGKPIFNTQVYLLDESLNPVAFGLPGEICIAGDGVGCGYINDRGLTEQKFVANPFSARPPSRLYRTGDLGRFSSDGNLEFIGRVDHQVKLRGFRIDLGDIESTLRQHKEVKEAVVLSKTFSDRDQRLVAFVVPRHHGDSRDQTGTQLRSFLKERLPEYMVPNDMVMLEEMPLNPNGKTDCNALLSMDILALGTQVGVEEPRTPEERDLAAIFAKVLKLERVGIVDNFFDLGGHSLLVTQVVSQVRRVLGAELSLRQVFESPTVAGLAEQVLRVRGLQVAAGPRIESVSREQDLPLSLQQEQLWFLEQITAGSTVYSLPATVRLKGDLDKLALRLSLEEIVRRHEILRTSFVQVDAKPKQRIHETGNFELVERDLRETANGLATEERINREQKEEATSPFLLSQPNLFRAKLLRVAEQEHILLLTFHHIVFDGWSIGVMVNELGQLYKAYHEGRSSPLPELPIQYADYTVWQREVMAEGEFVDGLEYWKKELEDLSELDLPSDHPRPAVQSFRGTVERWEMSPEVSAAIRKVSQEQGVTLFMTLLAGFQILLARYSGQRDIVVGSPIANRAQPELEVLIGFFVNTLVLRGDVNSDLTVEAVLQRAREVCLGAYAHQSVPFERLVDELQPERDSSRSPLFQVVLVLQNAPVGALQMQGVELSMLPTATSGARFDLTLLVEDDPEQLRGMMEYCTDLYERPTMRRMLDHYQQVLREIARDPGQLVSTLPLLSPAERQQLLAAWNHPYAESQETCLHELFEQQASLTPNALAVAHKGSSLTYTELNQRANQLGRHLKRLGVGSEELVGILLSRCSELLVAMLGVLKASAAYVLLDPDDRDQLAYILKDARPDVIVSEQRLSNKLPAHSGRTVYLDAQWNESSQESEQNVEAHVHPENLAYVTYRSEGTKTPEGVAVQHGNVASLACWAKSVLSADDLQRVLTSNPPTSDLSILDTYVPLCSGGTVVVVDDSFYGVDLEEGNATLINVTPSVMRELLRRKAVPPSVRTIILTGEPVPSGLVSKIYDNCDVKRVFNLYGHSEAAFGFTVAELHPQTENTRILIGKPVGNTQAFVLDAQMELMPVGTVGELYVAGASLARGYFNQPDLTAERFLPNPFSGAGGRRFYRTGELARYKANGEIELWGRVGYETRIRGHRIDLEEIERTLERQPEVADAVVVVQPTDTDANQLVAYIVPHSLEAAKGNALERTLRVALKQRLPEYMVPSHWATLERLPLLPDGKLDRSALPAVQPKSDLKQSASLPASDTERTVTAIWKQILKIEEVGVEDNFFDVGGQSLLIPEVHGALQKQFGTSLTIVELFQYSTIRALADRLDSEKIPSPQIAPAMVAEIIETEQPRVRTKGLAVIGMACRFPGARNIDEFWRNLQAGVESTVEFSDEELRKAGIAESVFTSPTYVKHSAILDDVDLFDARFFNMSAREAELIDPQQRALLECAWEALEDAGYSSETYKGSVGVYAGSGAPTYLLNLGVDHKAMDPNDATPMFFANTNDLLATRVAYKLNLTGPSITVQTACSTSLVTVHVASRALLHHECDLALAGGVTIRTPQVMGDSFMEGGIVSPDGHCRTFDERAQGTVRSNGVGIVVLKRLEDALRDRDCIHAIIRGSAINNDGSQKVGFTAPSVSGQRDVIQQALRDSGVDPETISYVEAHGTATPMGDPIEVTALTQAYRISTSRKAYCAVGSVKSNIGHTDCAAGVAGLIKTVLALEHKQIPATLNFQQPNPKIDFANSPFYVNATLSEWKTNGVPRRAGVSSFGIGGTNAHVILEEAPSDDSISVCRPWQLILLSAKTATALEAAADNLGAYLVANDSVSLPDVAHTLQVGRASFSHRSFVVAENNADATAALKDRQVRSLAASAVSRAGWPVAFLFPGQGSQYFNMGKQLYAQEPLFRELVDECSELLQPNLQLDLRSVLYPTSEKHEWAEAELRETRTTQPALFVVEYALARMWMSWGLLPERMLGHSVGEYVAACLAGVLSLEDALNLVTVRGRLMQSCARGGMLAIAASEKEVQRCLKMGLDLAAINGSASCVLSGPFDALELAEKELARQQVVHRRLQSSHAFHSAMMDPIIDQFVGEVEKVRLNAPRMRYLSNLTGEWITEEQVTDPEYWGKQLRGTVQFAKGIRNLCDGSDRLTLEVGPGHTNTTAIRQTLPKPALPLMLTTLPDSQTEESDVKHVLTVLGHLWLHGASVDWNAFASGEKRRRLPLPTYPFERQRYWVEAQVSRGSRPDTSRKKLDDWLYLPSWKEAARISSGSKADVSESATVLMFGGNSRFEEKLALKLGRKRYDVVTVVAGKEYTRVDHQTYAIRPTARADYDALFAVLGEQGQLPEKILHLWNIGHSDSVEQDVDIALYSPLHLVQAATAEQGMGPIQCVVVSSGLHEITGHEDLSPGKATLLGLCKTIACELPHFACKSVDIEVPAENSRTEDSLVDQLVAELESKEQQPVVSYRGVRRWIQTFDQVHLEADGTELVREGGVYLITGGLNDIGFQFAEWLATEARASIVLLDQRSFPRREHWDIWPETHTGDPAVKQISRIRAWEQGGAKVLISSADVANQAQMNELRNQVQGVWGKVNGVIHAAGFSKRGPLALKTRNDVATILMPKIQGALVLEEVFGGEDLDFMVFCSSLISVIGEAEQADYAAANAFLDSLARRNFLVSPYFTMSINWDTWGEADRDVSSAASGAACGAIRPDEAVEVLRRLLRAKPGPQAIISTRDLAAVARPRKVETAEERAGTVGRIYARPNLDRPIELPTNATETLLAPLWTEVLGVSPIGIHDDFFDLGGDSLIGLRMIARLEDLGIHISIEQLFRHRTVQELAALVEQGMLGDATTSSTSSGTSALQTVAIPRVDRKGKLPLSYGQERLWFIYQLAPENAAYNMPGAVRIQGPLDVESLERTLREIVRRHESLRTRFVSVVGEPQQIIDASPSVELLETELSHLPKPEREVEARRLAQQEARQPFDLERGPLFRARLLRLGSQDHVLVFNMHHIVSDMWSVGVLVREVSAIYNNFSTGQPSPLPELDIQYADFSVWQREVLSGPLLEAQLEYWKQKLDAVEPLMLPIDLPRAPLQRQDGATMHFTVPLELTEALRTLSRKQGATLYMVVLAAFKALLCRYSGQHDIAVGSAIAGRFSRTETEALIGFFINSLVLRTDLSGQPDSLELLRRVKETTLGAYANQDVPFEKLVEVLLPQRDLSRSPLFQVMLIFQNVPGTALQLGAAKMLPFVVHSGAAQREITLFLTETGSGIEGIVEFSTNLFEAGSVTRMIDHYQMLLNGIVANPSQSIAAIPLLTADERKQVVEEWNRTEHEIPEGTLVELFETQVQRSPGTVAVIYEEERLTYGELNHRTNQLGWRLRELGVGPESRVGLLVERSLEMVVGLLGVLKAGGAYVPLDPDYPPERLSYMLESSQVKVLLTQEHLREQLPAYNGLVLELDGAEERRRIAEQRAANLEVPLDPEHLAYIIYTSGSTGRPKGVMNSHGGLLNRLLWMQEEYRLEAGDVVLQKTPFSFDVSVWEFLLPLLEGAKLVVARPGGHQDPNYLAKLIEDQQITTLHFVPSMLAVFLEEERAKRCKSIRRVVCSGEALPPDLARRCLATMPWAELHNLYGPTEAAIDVTYWKCLMEDTRASVPIGKGIANIRLYVVDEGMEPVPVGVPGELCLGGVGLARGYWRRGDLTAERFVPDGLSGRRGERLYRTGDLARWRGDGNLEYLGRLDQQVKIREFRIELGEIEAVLQEHEGVRQAAVTVQEEKNTRQIVAYVVLQAGQVFDAIDLKRHLRQKLPEAMVPETVVEIAELPLTASGKIDRKRLPKVEGTKSRAAENGVAPRTEVERYIAEVWREFLQIDKVGVEDNFFDLGGHSLMIVLICARLASRFNDRIKLVDLFSYPTIAALAKYLERSQDDTALELAALERAGRQLQAFAAVTGGRREVD